MPHARCADKRELPPDHILPISAVVNERWIRWVGRLAVRSPGHGCVDNDCAQAVFNILVFSPIDRHMFKCLTEHKAFDSYLTKCTLGAN